MKKLLVLILGLFISSCEPAIPDTPLLKKDLYTSTNLSGAWTEKRPNGNQYYFYVSLPNENNDVKFSLAIREYERNKIVFSQQGTFPLYDFKEGMNKFGDKVKYIKLRYTNDNGEEQERTNWMYIQTKLRSGTRVLEGAQLRFIFEEERMGRGMKKSTFWTEGKEEAYKYENFKMKDDLGY